jgi:hypothetical protein
MSGTIKHINNIDEYMRDGDDPPSLYGSDYLPLEPTYHDNRPAYKPESEFEKGFWEWFDNCAAVAGILILGPFLLMLVFLSLPILIPYSIFYLVKKVVN